MAGAYLQILQGDSYSFSTNIAVDGVAQNVYGATLWFLAKADPLNDADSDAIISANTNSGQITISGSSSNVVTVTLNSATTANYTQSNVLFWSLKAELASGLVYTLDRGRACVMTPVVLTN